MSEETYQDFKGKYENPKYSKLWMGSKNKLTKGELLMYIEELEEE